MGCLLDLTSRQISYMINGASMGVAFEVPAQMQGQPLYPAVTLKGAKISTCFGGSGAKFHYGPPAGFTGIADAPNNHLTTGVPSMPKCTITHSLSVKNTFSRGKSAICRLSFETCAPRDSHHQPLRLTKTEESAASRRLGPTDKPLLQLMWTSGQRWLTAMADKNIWQLLK